MRLSHQELRQPHRDARDGTDHDDSDDHDGDKGQRAPNDIAKLDVRGDIPDHEQIEITSVMDRLKCNYFSVTCE